MRYLIFHASFLATLLITGCNNNLDKAEESLTKALEIDNNYPEVNRIYADTLRKKGELEKSIIFANKAKDLAPNSVNILDTLGTCLASNKQYKEAEKYYDLALNFVQIQN